MTFLKLNNQPVAKTFQGSFGDLFNEFENTINHLVQPPAIAGNVPANVVENTDGFHMELMAPGRVKEKFNLQVEKNLLTISYEAPVAEKLEVKQIRKEFSTGSFKRSFNLSDAINTNDIQAKYEDGLLKVFLPKKEEAKPVNKQITVQ